MNTLRPIGLFAIALASAAVAACSSSQETPQNPQQAAAADQKARTEALDRIDQGANLLHAFREKIPNSLAAQAQCVVVVPAMKTGGLIVGAQHGNGAAACKTPQGWSGPVPVTISGGTFGAQVGFQSTDFLALVKTPAAVGKLSSGNLKIGVDASASAGPVGTGRGSASDIESYSRSQGLFAGATLNGTTVSEDKDSTRALYGASQNMRSVLEGQVKPPQDPAVQRFMTALNTNFPAGAPTASLTPTSSAR